MSDQLGLRPVEEDDLAMMESLTQDPEIGGEFAWLGWFDRGRYQRMWDEHRFSGDDVAALIVTRGQERLGFVSWRRRFATPKSYCYTMGIALLPEARGKGYGTETHRLLARYLFAHTTVHRIEADTEVDNIAEQRALEKAGFTREGVTRAGAWRAGAWRDGVTYSLLRTDPQV